MRHTARLMGLFALLLGLTAFAAGLGLLFGVPASSDGLACKAICGLSLLTTQLFGPAVGAVAGGLLWVGAGAVAAFFGVRLLRDSRGA